MRKLEPIARLNVRRSNMVKRTYVLKTELKMDANEVVKELKYWVI